MTLQGLAGDLVSGVLPRKAITIESSTGYSTGTDGTRTPTYTPITTTGSVQPLSAKDLQHINSLNIQGVVQKLWLDGNYEGLFRVTGQGGDLIKFDSQTYLVATVFERWPGWCSLGLTMQLDGP